MIQDRGFASMNADKQREIASKGGRAAHEKGTAHEWTREEAREAGRKGGRMTHRRRSSAPDSGATAERPDVDKPDALVAPNDWNW
jgi:uncharacterized protein